MFSIDQQEKHLKIEAPKGLIEIYLHGALLTRWQRSEGDVKQELIDGFLPEGEESFEAFFKSAKLSPFACRMKNGSYTFEEKKYRAGRFWLGDNALHGLFYDAPFELIHQEITGDKASVHLGYAYLGTEEGYPFNIHLKISYHLFADGHVQIDTVVNNTGKENCPLADGWHPYFRLDVPVDECRLTLNSHLQVVMDDCLLPTGALHENDLFFHGPKTIGQKHFDDCFQLEPETGHLPQARLMGRQWQLEIFANENYPFLQIYTPQHRSSIAIENLSALPDCFNNLAGLQVLSPGEEVRFSCSYRANFIAG